MWSPPLRVVKAASILAYVALWGPSGGQLSVRPSRPQAQEGCLKSNRRGYKVEVGTCEDSDAQSHRGECVQNRKYRPAEAEVDSSGFQYVAIGLMVAVWVFKRTKTILFLNFLKE